MINYVINYPFKEVVNFKNIKIVKYLLLRYCKICGMIDLTKAILAQTGRATHS